MDSNKSDPSPADIVELQRDCHPFPAYIDFMQGRPTEYELMMEDASLPEDFSLGNSMVPTNESGMSAPYQHDQTSSFQYSAPLVPIPAVGPYPSPQSMHAATPSYILGNTMASRIPFQPPGGLGQNQQQQKPSPFGSTMTITGYGVIGEAQQIQAQRGGALGQSNIGSSPPSLFAGGPVPTQLSTDILANRPPMMYTHSMETQPQPMVMGTLQPKVSAPSSAPSPNPAPNTSSASTVHKPPILILQRDDLLKPDFNWMPQPARAATNANVSRLHDTIANENIPMSTRNAATVELVTLGTHVMEARKKALLFKIHQTMPSFYDAVMVRRHYPSHHPDAIKANEYIQKARQKFPQTVRDYMERLLTEMIKRAMQGKVPYEAVPGWLEQWNKKHGPKTTNERLMVQDSGLEQSKGESSPLPQWKRA